MAIRILAEESSRAGRNIVWGPLSEEGTLRVVGGQNDYLFVFILLFPGVD